MKNKFTFKKRVGSLLYALKGLKIVFSTQPNAWIHSTALIIVVVAGFAFHLDFHEWIAITFAAGLVFVAEIINTSIEFLTDNMFPEYHEQAAKIKDTAAAAALVAAMVSVIVAAFVFIPKFW